MHSTLTSFEQHAKLATMLTGIFFEHACSEWNMHVPHVEHGKISCHLVAPRLRHTHRMSDAYAYACA